MSRVERAHAACAEAFVRYRDAAEDAHHWAGAAARAATLGEMDQARAHARAHRAACEARGAALVRYDRALHELHATLLEGAQSHAAAATA